MVNVFRKAICQHNHYLGLCAACEQEVNDALDEMDNTGTVVIETWRALNHWQRGALMDGKRFGPTTRKDAGPDV